MKWRQGLLLHFFLFISLQTIFGRELVSKSSKAGKINYLFIEWRHWNNTVVLGHFSNNRLNRIEEVVCDINKLDEQVLSKWLKDPEQAALFSFHCMWGQQPWFHRMKYLSSFNEIVSTTQQPGIRTFISFIWHAGGINYKNNWNKAAGKGAFIGKSLAAINQYYKKNSYIFCHSMGSRFFEGALQSMPADQDLFKAIILFSPDLPADIHQKEFKQIEKAAGAIVVFKHQKDKPLLLSSLMLKCKRLGRSGPLPLIEGNKMIVYDMTGKVKGFQHHAHINKKWPKEMLVDFFNTKR